MHSTTYDAMLSIVAKLSSASGGASSNFIYVNEMRLPSILGKNVTKYKHGRVIYEYRWVKYVDSFWVLVFFISM